MWVLLGQRVSMGEFTECFNILSAGSCFFRIGATGCFKMN